ncbi:dual specificity protein phosphatase MPK-4 [Lycorma delicatula]|uniref:dual specificity protein phosphatase MPK-4 n=1 Tax=Lycorma delicatula TaxID=130591 RepID=UPI003F5188F8
MESRKAKKHGSTSQLLREDFDAGPTNLDCIEPGLWLGNLTAAMDLELLEERKINYILTVDSCPLPRVILSVPSIHNMFIQVTDIPCEDLLSHFEEAYKFIANGQENGVVLVHCYFGISRSATIVIAYFMKKYQISFDEAFERVKKQRRFVGPNKGFEAQLRLYERMGCTINKSNAQFRMFRLKVAADKVRKVKILPQDCLDVVRPDPALITVKPDPLVYRCCRCRRIVASASNLLPHVAREKPTWKNEDWPPVVNNEDKPLCMMTYFIEPLSWMKSVLQSVEGKIYCPKCNSKIGSFSWIMGCQCPCGAKVSPAFYLVPSKVEWSNFVQNVQVTV